MLLGFTNTKKMPRLFLLQSSPVGPTESAKPIAGIRVQWPFELGHADSEVLDLSLSGLAIQGTGLLSKIKVGQSFEVKLKIETVREAVSLKVRVVRLHAKFVGIAFESISTEGRLILDQAVKDRLVSENLRRWSPIGLNPEFHPAEWFHGPFDTNFFIWRKEDGSLRSALVEYDHLIWLYQEGKITLQKSGSSTDETKGYIDAGITTSYDGSNKLSAKVSMGASWLDRLMKLLDMASAEAELQGLKLLLRSQRSQ